jgi:hypothetical protein
LATWVSYQPIDVQRFATIYWPSRRIQLSVRKVCKKAEISRLSKDGKWKSFEKTPNLLQNVPSGVHYAQGNIGGKLFCEGANLSWRLVSGSARLSFKSGAALRLEKFATNLSLEAIMTVICLFRWGSWRWRR